jgi:hypothetical protein
VTRAVLFAAASALLAGGCQKFKDIMNPPMADFTSPDGKWKAKFPGGPSEKSKSAFGVSFTMWGKEPWGGKGGYMVGVADLPIPATESDPERQKRLDDGITGSAGGVGGKVRETKRIMLHGRYPGRECVASITEPKVGQYKCRMYLVGNRMYMVAVMGVDEFVTAPQAAEFLDSFALTGETAPAHAPGGITNPAERLATRPTKAPPAEEPLPKATGTVINSTSGKFKAHFPEAPKKGTATTGEVTFTTYAVTTNGAAYAAGYADQPDLGGVTGKQRQEALDAARDAAVADLGAGAKLGKVELVVLAGKHRGWEFEATAGDRVQRARVYLAGTRLYRLTVRGSADAVKAPDADRFFETFQVTN